VNTQNACVLLIQDILSF